MSTLNTRGDKKMIKMMPDVRQVDPNGDIAVGLRRLQSVLENHAGCMEGPILAGEVVAQVGEIARRHSLVVQDGKPWNARLHGIEHRVAIANRIGRAIVRLVQLANAHHVQFVDAVINELEADEASFASFEETLLDPP